jgi:hypothetical protein
MATRVVKSNPLLSNRIKRDSQSKLERRLMQTEVSNPAKNPNEEAYAHLMKEIGHCKKCNDRRFLGFNITYKRPVYCTCFIKHMNKMRFASLQKDTGSDETLQKVQ